MAQYHETPSTRVRPLFPESALLYEFRPYRIFVPAELHQVALSFAIRLDNKRAASPPQSPKPPFF